MPVSIPRKLDLSVVALFAWFGLLAASGRGSLKPPRNRGPARGSTDPLAALRRELAHPASGASHLTDEVERGREANSPYEITARGWRDILKRVAHQFSAHQLMDQAASMAYYSLLAVFPGLAALVSIYGLLADPATIEKQINSLDGVIPGGGMDLISQQLHSLASANNGALGFGAVIGILLALWSANGATKGMFDALNIVYDEQETRGYFTRTAVSLALTLGGIVLIVIALACVVALPIVLQFLGLGTISDWLINVLRWPLLLVLITIGLAVIYRYGPSRHQARWSWLSWGSAAAAILWIIGSALFSWYVANFGNYNKTYGSLGAVVGFMTWLWLSSLVVLIGAELNAEMEHQTRRDTTIGPEKPLGGRGATKADKVARAA